MQIDFRELLKRAAKKFSSQQALADELGMSLSRLNRALNKGDYPFNVLNCLKLANLSGESPSAVLRAGGKAEIADLIEKSYGAPDQTITAREREHLAQWRSIDDETRGAVSDRHPTNGAHCAECSAQEERHRIAREGWE